MKNAIGEVEKWLLNNNKQLPFFFTGSLQRVPLFQGRKSSAYLRNGNF